MNKSNNIIDKLRDFFIKIKDNFFKDTKKLNEAKREIDGKNNKYEKQQELANNFIETLNKDVSQNEFENMDKKAYLKQLEGNDELLSKLSIERLVKLSKYYDEVIKSNKEKLATAKK